MYEKEPRPPSYWTHFTSAQTLKQWNIHTKSGLSKVTDIDQSTHKAIADIFCSTFTRGLRPTITNIQRIENTDLFMKYCAENQRLFRKVYVEGELNHLSQMPMSSGPVVSTDKLDQNFQQYLHGEINEFYVFHATKADVVGVIPEQGLDARLANAGRLGRGVYGAEISAKSHGYASKLKFFRAQEPKAPVTYCDHALSGVRPSVRRPSSVRLFTFSTSSPEPIDGFWWNLVWMKYSRSLTSVVVFRPDPSRGGSRAGQK